MPRNWVWNFNPNPVAKTDEVNEALIGRCAKEKLKKKWMEEVKSENGNETASGNEVEWQGIGRWLAAAWRSVSRLVPSRVHRNCTSSSCQRKFITMRRRIESITWCHVLKSARRTCWLAARRWRRPNTSLGSILFELLKKKMIIFPLGFLLPSQNRKTKTRELKLIGMC